MIAFSSWCRGACRQIGGVSVECQSPPISSQLFLRVRLLGGFHRHDQMHRLAMVIALFKQLQMSTEVRNWDCLLYTSDAADE